MTTVAATMPSARFWSSAAWADGVAFVVGGNTGSGGTDEILEYDPVADAVRVAGRLPWRGWGAGAAWDGSHVYTFGGRRDDYTFRDEILRFDPATGTVGAMGARFPSPRGYTTAVWTGASALVFAAGEDNRVFRYVPATDNLTAFASTVPRGELAAAWTGAYVYLFGGWDGVSESDEILRFDPATDTMTTLAARLPETRRHANAFYDGRWIYVVGGDPTDILRFDLATETIASAGFALPEGRGVHAGAWSGVDLFVFGGVVAGSPRADILRVTPNPPFRPPAAPVVTASSGPGLGEITLAWSPPDDGGKPITEYRVFGSSAFAGPFTLLGTTPTPGFVETGLAGSEERYYEVSAVNAVGEGARSIVANASAPPPVPPGAPTAFTAGQGGAPGEIALAWSPPANDGTAPVLAYRVYHASPGGTLALLAETSATTLTSTGLGEGETREFAVSARNVAGEGAATARASATTAARPGAPASAAASAGPGVGEATVSWSAPASDGGLPVSSYRVYAGASPTSLALAATLSAGASSWTESGLGEGVTRHYAIAAANAVGEGAASATVSATTFARPSAPRNLDADATGVGSIALAWDPPASDGGTPVTGYVVQRKSALDAAWNDHYAEASGTAFTDEDALPFVAYSYRVVARNLVGEGPPSNVASAICS